MVMDSEGAVISVSKIPISKGLIIKTKKSITVIETYNRW
jgi:hypothetical protein